MNLLQMVADCGMIKLLEKLDKDRFRQDLGDVIESYHMVAHRLGMQIKVD